MSAGSAMRRLCHYYRILYPINWFQLPYYNLQLSVRPDTLYSTISVMLDVRQQRLTIHLAEVAWV